MKDLMNLNKMGIEIAPQVAREVATVQAKLIMAKQFPRDEKIAISRVIEECDDYDFCEKCLYVLNYGSGKPVTGLTVRMAEFLATLWGNLDIVNTITLNDDLNLGFTMSIIDLQTNTTYSSATVIEKTVWRLYVKKGQDVLDQRVNSQGKVSYKVKATEDECLQKLNVWKSKEKRNVIFNIVPISCRTKILNKVKETLNSEITGNKKEHIEKLVKAFNDEGVEIPEIEAMIGGKKMSKLSADDIVILRCIFKQISASNKKKQPEKESDGTFSLEGEPTTKAEDMPGYVSTTKTRYQNLSKDKKRRVLDILSPSIAISSIKFTKSTTRERCQEINQAIDSLSTPDPETKNPIQSDNPESKENEDKSEYEKLALLPHQSVVKANFDKLLDSDQIKVVSVVWNKNANIPTIENWATYNEKATARINNAIRDLNAGNSNEVKTDNPIEILKEAFNNLNENQQGYLLGLYEIKESDFDDFDKRFAKTIMDEIIKISQG